MASVTYLSLTNRYLCVSVWRNCAGSWRHIRSLEDDANTTELANIFSAIRISRKAKKRSDGIWRKCSRLIFVYCCDSDSSPAHHQHDEQHIGRTCRVVQSGFTRVTRNKICGSFPGLSWLLSRLIVSRYVCRRWITNLQNSGFQF